MVMYWYIDLHIIKEEMKKTLKDTWDGFNINFTLLDQFTNSFNKKYNVVQVLYFCL